MEELNNMVETMVAFIDQVDGLREAIASMPENEYEEMMNIVPIVMRIVRNRIIEGSL